LWESADLLRAGSKLTSSAMACIRINQVFARLQTESNSLMKTISKNMEEMGI
jgi:hypothetical protein